LDPLPLPTSGVSLTNTQPRAMARSTLRMPQTISSCRRSTTFCRVHTIHMRTTLRCDNVCLSFGACDDDDDAIYDFFYRCDHAGYPRSRLPRLLRGEDNLLLSPSSSSTTIGAPSSSPRWWTTPICCAVP
jgi:hypothetical protein